jgi:hypothetical protein
MKDNLANFSLVARHYKDSETAYPFVLLPKSVYRDPLLPDHLCQVDAS